MTMRYEQTDPTIRIFILHEEPEVIFGDGRWNEGPCYFPASRMFVWSDIPKDRLMRFDEISGTVCAFRTPSHHANGNTVDRQGRLVTCEHGTRRVTRTEFDGTVRILADRFEGRRLNSPNDVIVKSDGSIWFSDPTYGIDSDYFGNLGESELGVASVYRLDPVTSTVEAVITSMIQPNGLAFSRDESRLLVVDSARTGGPHLPAHIRLFDLSSKGRPEDRGIVVEASAGLFDGIRLDDQDRIWAGTGEGVHCYSFDGRLLGKILTGGPIINLCFGGPKRNIIYMCGPREVLRVPVRARGQNTFLENGNAS